MHRSYTCILFFNAFSPSTYSLGGRPTFWGRPGADRQEAETGAAEGKSGSSEDRGLKGGFGRSGLMVDCSQ